MLSITQDAALHEDLLSHLLPRIGGGGNAAALLIAKGLCFQHCLLRAANHPMLPCSRRSAGLMQASHRMCHGLLRHRPDAWAMPRQ